MAMQQHCGFHSTEFVNQRLRQPEPGPTIGGNQPTERQFSAVSSRSSSSAPHLGLRLLCTTDLHGHVWPFDYQTDTETPTRGLAALAPLIHAARAESRNSLLLDCGDILQGTALADWAVSPAHADRTHPMISAMNRLGYDAAGLGNHDFNYGLPPLRRALDDARFPIVCANLVTALGAKARDDIPFTPPWVILTRQLTDDTGQSHTLRIGVIGTAPPQTLIWDAQVLRGALAARDAVRAVKAHLPDLKAAGCDLVIALSHAGLGKPKPCDMAEDTSRALASLPGIDVILTGHSHRRFPGPDFAGLDNVNAAAGTIAGKPAAMAGAFGSDLATLDLDLEKSSKGWTIAHSRVALRTLGTTPGLPDPDILAATECAHTATRVKMREVVGHTRTRLHSVFAMAGPSPALTLLAQAQMARAQALVRGSPLADLPMLSAVAPFKHGGPNGPTGFVDIAPGPLLHRHMVELSPFPNQLCAMAVTGAHLRAWLERVAAAYLTVPHGAVDAPLLNPVAAAYTFDEIHGLNYTFDLSQPGAWDARTGAALPGPATPTRLTALTYRGRPVQPTDRFCLATSSYRASGGGGFAMIPRDTPRLQTSETLRDILTAHVRACGPIAMAQGPLFDFVPLGATALVNTAPHVTDDRHGDPGRPMQSLGLDAHGFHTFRLTL
jgi:2',3'-cyclic-nucleotide 2'-phosphodiesterase/3'-nucleotidase